MKIWSIRGIIVLLFAASLFAGCQGADEDEVKPAAEPVYFPAGEVCSYPEAGPGKVFSKLGGGRWAVSNPSEPQSAFECVGSRKEVQLWKDGGGIVQVEYVATGVEKGASLVSLTYTAAGSGPLPNESTWRNAFANLVEAVSRRGLGGVPPDLFKKKLANLASYSQPGKGLTENFDVGRGFILLTREASGNSEIKGYVKMFPDVVLKLEN
jgi:hypothetical protein